mmetsp:Transcript_24072/g.36743  ORF Transcript_24072/g.36743 Transcript_24072/m.36743 type:complete len:216 (-) Transcript_24072:1068-1715(-)
MITASRAIECRSSKGHVEYFITRSHVDGWYCIIFIFIFISILLDHIHNAWSVVLVQFSFRNELQFFGIMRSTLLIRQFGLGPADKMLDGGTGMSRRHRMPVRIQLHRSKPFHPQPPHDGPHGHIQIQEHVQLQCLDLAPDATDPCPVCNCFFLVVFLEVHQIILWVGSEESVSLVMGGSGVLVDVQVGDVEHTSIQALEYSTEIFSDRMSLTEGG